MGVFVRDSHWFIGWREPANKAVLPSLVNKMQRPSMTLCLFFFLNKIFSIELDANIKCKKGVGKKKPKTNVNWKQTSVHFLWRNFIFFNGVTVAFYFSMR